jgi:hypothetical protein
MIYPPGMRRRQEEKNSAAGFFERWNAFASAGVTRFEKIRWLFQICKKTSSGYSSENQPCFFRVCGNPMFGVVAFQKKPNKIFDK